MWVFSNVEGEFEPLPGHEPSPKPRKASQVRLHPTRRWVAIEWRGGWAVWEPESGKLVHVLEPACVDFHWLQESEQALVLYETALSRIVRLSVPDFQPVEELAFELPYESIHELVVSPSERYVVAYLNSGAGECGFELFRLEGGIQRTGIAELFTLAIMSVAPRFSPNERLIAFLEADEGARWFDEDAEELRKAGGAQPWQVLHLIEVETGEGTRHAMRLDLAPGWDPDSDELTHWEYSDGVEFVSDDTIRVYLPRAPRSADLRLPLPEVVLLEHGAHVAPPA
jgi:hypothetical protein